MRALGVLWLSCALAFLARPVSADIFRFVDRDGVVHYTNVQPDSRGWQKVYRETNDAEAGNLNVHRWQGPRVERRVDPERLTRFDAHIREAAKLYQLPEPFIRAIMQVESNFYPDVVSEDGAMGLMQLMPATAANMGVVDAFDPRQNVL